MKNSRGMIKKDLLISIIGSTVDFVFSEQPAAFIFSKMILKNGVVKNNQFELIKGLYVELDLVEGVPTGARFKVHNSSLISGSVLSLLIKTSDWSELFEMKEFESKCGRSISVERADDHHSGWLYIHADGLLEVVNIAVFFSKK